MPLHVTAPNTGCLLAQPLSPAAWLVAHWARRTHSGQAFDWTAYEGQGKTAGVPMQSGAEGDTNCITSQRQLAGQLRIPQPRMAEAMLVLRYCTPPAPHCCLVAAYGVAYRLEGFLAKWRDAHDGAECPLAVSRQDGLSLTMTNQEDIPTYRELEPLLGVSRNSVMQMLEVYRDDRVALAVRSGALGRYVTLRCCLGGGRQASPHQEPAGDVCCTGASLFISY